MSTSYTVSVGMLTYSAQVFYDDVPTSLEKRNSHWFKAGPHDGEIGVYKKAGPAQCQLRCCDVK